MLHRYLLIPAAAVVGTAVALLFGFVDRKPPVDADRPAAASIGTRPTPPPFIVKAVRRADAPQPPAVRGSGPVNPMDVCAPGQVCKTGLVQGSPQDNPTAVSTIGEFIDADSLPAQASGSPEDARIEIGPFVDADDPAAGSALAAKHTPIAIGERRDADAPWLVKGQVRPVLNIGPTLDAMASGPRP